MTQQETGTVYRNDVARQWRTERPEGVLAVHRTIPGYAPTRLVELPGLARELGVASVHVKEECARFGLPAFKMLGASHAIVRALRERYGLHDDCSFEDLATVVGQESRPVLVTATDGNHGRGVAHVAALLGLDAEVFVPACITQQAKDAIRGEGARLTELDLAYDDVVAHAARHAEASGGMLVQDTAWQGYERIPQWIVDGYSTLFVEADEQLARAGIVPDVVAVPVGVGSLAQAAVTHYRSGDSAPSVVCVEPQAAPAVHDSLLAGEAVQVSTGTTVMAGLNCGTPSYGAWPTLHQGLDAAVLVDDEQVVAAVRDLQEAGVDSGPCGAATLAGVRALHADRPLPPDAHVLLVSTEGRDANPLPQPPAAIPTATVDQPRPSRAALPQPR